MESSSEGKKVLEFCRCLLNQKVSKEILWTGSGFELPVKFFLDNITDLDSIAYSSHLVALPITLTETKTPIYSGNSSEKRCRRTPNGSSTSSVNVVRMSSKESHPGFTELLFDKLSTKSERFTRKHLRRDTDMKACYTIDLFQSTSSAFEYLGCLREENSQIANLEKFTMDWVDAILCPVWPEEANEWKFRERPYQVPSPEMIDSIVKSGCFLIAKPHDRTSKDTSQWRISFSKAEMALIHSWSDVQLYIYHVLRLVKNDAVSKCGGSEVCHLKTYHIKTLMLWACEKRPLDFWDKRHLQSSLIELLCELIECLNNKECKNYFIPDNNMLDHISNDANFDLEIQCIVSSIDNIRCYIDRTIHLCDSNSDDVFTALLPNKLLWLGQLRFYNGYLVEPSLIGRKRYRPVTPLEDTEYFRSKVTDLYKALGKHRSLQVHSFEDKDEAIKEAVESFRCCRSRTLSGYTKAEYSFKDNGHQLVARCLRINFANSNNHYRPTSKVRRNSNHNNQVLETEIDRIDEFIFHSIPLNRVLHHINIDIEDPFYLLCGAYEANMYCTLADSDKNPIYLYTKALMLSHKLICQAENLEKRYTWWIANNEIRLPVLISRDWVSIFDKHIQTIYGILTLVLAVQNSYSYNPQREEIGEILIHVGAADFLRYTRIQCNRKLGRMKGVNVNDKDDVVQMKRLTMLSPSTIVLYSALRLH